MKKEFKLLRILLFFNMICCFQIGTSQTFTNPVGNLADPFITFIDGYYYYTGTTGVDVSIKRATTLEGLKQTPLTRLFGPTNSGAQQGPYWAPKLFKLDGKWYIYYSASQQGTDELQMRTYVLENPSNDPMNPSNWIFKGKIYSPGADYWAIDGTVLELYEKRYFIWSGVSTETHFSGGSKPQSIFISSMSNPLALEGSRELLVNPGELSGSNIGDVAEGPSTFIKGDKVFMTYSANGCWTSEYKLGLLSLETTQNPLNINSWTKYHDPVFVSNPENSSYAPGHNSFFYSPDDSEYWIAYHATPNSSGDCGNTRTSRVQKFGFDVDGIPQFGEVTQVGAPLVAPLGEPNLSTGTIENGLYKISQKNTSKLIEISGAIYTNPANAVQWEDSDSLHQQWWVQSVGDGFYTIISALSGLALEVGGCEFGEFANINIWSPNGANCQLWEIEALGSGEYRFLNENSGKAMEVNASGIDNNGANIQQSTWSNSNNQIFNLELIRETLKLESLKFNPNIVVYPNPAKEHLTISGLHLGETKKVRIHDVYGKIIDEYETHKDSLNITTSHLQSGLYFILISSATYEAVSKKVLIQ